MIPRTVLMAKEVSAQLTSTQLEDYGNIILNGYLSIVPNTSNKKAWQYKETTTSPVNLPSLTEVYPVLKGWSTNYGEYYTQLPVNSYNQVPGNPTMFEYGVHSWSNLTGPIQTLGGNGTWISGGSGYTPGVYTGVTLSGGSGTGALATVTVADVYGVNGPVVGWSQLSTGSGYVPGSSLVDQPTSSVTGRGYGLTVDGSTGAGAPFSLTVTSINNPGQGYNPGDIIAVPGGVSLATLEVQTVGVRGTVTSVILTSPGTGYEVGDALTTTLPGGGSGFYAPVGSINADPGTGGEPLWSQPPTRRNQLQVSDTTPPQYVNNPSVIQYSYMYPIVDNPDQPPIDTLTP